MMTSETIYAAMIAVITSERRLLLVIKLTERSDSSVDPVALRMLRWNVQHQDEVGRMSCGAKYATSGTGLIDRALVDWTCFKLVRLARTQPDHWQRVIEDLG